MEYFVVLSFPCSYRHMGVIGSVMVMRQLALSSAAFDMNRTVASQHNSTSPAGLSPARRRKVSPSLSLSLSSRERSVSVIPAATLFRIV